MKITAGLLTVGTEPEVKFVDSGVQVTFSAAENHNYNAGTKENPDWKQTGTSWFNMVAYGDTANEILDELDVGDGFRLEAGAHKWNNIGTKEDPDYRPVYKIYEFEKIDKKND